MIACTVTDFSLPLYSHMYVPPPLYSFTDHAYLWEYTVYTGTHCSGFQAEESTNNSLLSNPKDRPQLGLFILYSIIN